MTSSSFFSGRTLLFSFSYGERSSRDLLATWDELPIDGGIAWTDPDSKLRVELHEVDNAEHGATEWYLRFTNGGEEDSLELSDILSLDLDTQVPASQHSLASVTLGRSRGSTFSESDFDYQEDRLLPGEALEMHAGAGRASQNWLPFFSVDLGGHGVMIAVGWSGEWKVAAAHTYQSRLTVTAGMRDFSAYLRPGESVRGPRMLMLEFTGGIEDAHNQLRRYLLEHHTPRLDGAPIDGPFTIAHWGGMNTAGQLERLEAYKRERVPQEYFWLDAGWYGDSTQDSPDEFSGDWADHVGDWWVNSTHHPHGLGPIRDAAAAAGMKFLLWAEPGRAIETSSMVTEHPKWYLGSGRERLLNFGDPAAREGAADIFSALIDDLKIDLFREDYNINPLAYWADADEPGRTGITEAKYIEGFYWFWDELRRRHPRLIIDNCASGGRRIELETISRSVALWRSDWQCFPDADPEVAQTHGMGLSWWIPLHGTGFWASLPTSTNVIDPYRVRSGYGPALQLSAFPRESPGIPDDYPWETFRSLGNEYLEARQFFVGDYFPLTGTVDLARQPWLAYQLDRPDLASGLVMAFRRGTSLTPEFSATLRNIDPSASYELRDADTGGTRTVTGSEFAAFTVQLDNPRSSSLTFYRKL